MALKRSPLASVMRLGQAAEAAELDQFIEVLREIKRGRFGTARKVRKTSSTHKPVVVSKVASDSQA